jgi:hypothetical protein
MLMDPQAVQQALVVKPLDLTQVLLFLITTIAGFITVWLNGKKTGRMESSERRISEHAELAASAAATAERHATVAVQASMYPKPNPAPLIQSLPPEALESEPPASMGTIVMEPPRPTRPKPPIDRPTPKDPSIR